MRLLLLICARSCDFGFYCSLVTLCFGLNGLLLLLISFTLSDGVVLPWYIGWLVVVFCVMNLTCLDLVFAIGLVCVILGCL